MSLSFDVFFQGFIGGESSRAGGAQMRGVLAPYVAEKRGSFLHVRVGDGEADVYFDYDDGIMANHRSELFHHGMQANRHSPCRTRRGK